MLVEEKEILTKTIKQEGLENRLSRLQEECGELVVAISHYRRKKNTWNSVCEEMSHVQILINQISLLENNCELITGERIKKIKRLEKKLRC
jgi:NTP pyrophosphatase (non-canonical NTP hydrolase)